MRKEIRVVDGLAPVFAHGFKHLLKLRLRHHKACVQVRSMQLLPREHKIALRIRFHKHRLDLFAIIPGEIVHLAQAHPRTHCCTGQSWRKKV